MPVDVTEPLCGEEEYEQLMSGMVVDEAPRLFAVVQEYGVRVDARVAAWGMAFEDHAEIIGVEGSLRMRVRSPESWARRFANAPDVTARLIWVDTLVEGPANEFDTA